MTWVGYFARNSYDGRVSSIVEVPHIVVCHIVRDKPVIGHGCNSVNWR